MFMIYITNILFIIWQEMFIVWRVTAITYKRNA